MKAYSTTTVYSATAQHLVLSAGLLLVAMPCDLCVDILWFDLQPEDVRGKLHHKSRRALEESAETCEVCRMILRAAISNYKDAWRTRHGRGYWVKLVGVEYVDETGSRDLFVKTALGACMPAEGKTLPSMKGQVLAPTGHIDSEGRNIKDDAPDLGALGLDEDPTGDMPVWPYGDWWAASAPVEEGDQSHLRLVRVGARFARSESVLDVFNTGPGNMELRGSAIGICSNDGEQPRAHLPRVPSVLSTQQVPCLLMSQVGYGSSGPIQTSLSAASSAGSQTAARTTPAAPRPARTPSYRAGS